MSEILNKLELYNRDIKMRYLDDQFEEQSAITIGYVLAKAATVEEALEKDLARFTLEEIDLVMYTINPVNISSSLRYGGILRNYINWAMSNGFGTGSSINVLEGLGEVYYKKFVGNKKTHISKDELYNSVLAKLKNNQDKLPLLLAFEGVAGEELYEQRHLTEDCIIDDNTLKVPKEDGGYRELKVSSELIELIRKANEEKIYLYKNGESAGRRKESDLNHSRYVIRKPIRDGMDSGFDDVPVEKFVLYNRLRKIGNEYTDYPQLTYKNLQQSGMIYLAYKIYIEKGKFEDTDYHEVAKHFNIKKSAGKDKAYYNMGSIKRAVTRENILNLYGVDIEK